MMNNKLFTKLNNKQEFIKHTADIRPITLEEENNFIFMLETNWLQ